MNIDAAIESFFSWSRTNCPWEGQAHTPIFFLGRYDDVNDAIDTLKADLLEDLLTSPALPIPFEVQTLFVEFDTEFQLAALRSKRGSVYVDEIEKRRLMPLWEVSIIQKDSSDPRIINIATFFYGHARGWDSIYRGGGRFFPMEGGEQFGFQEFSDSGTFLSNDTSKKSGERIKRDIYRLALIAHPSNYIVRETPLLTPKEERRIASGKRPSDAKRPRYIIVDHDVLVNRMKPQGGTHAAPAPHQRRGHWRRLAERCKLMRARGYDKTFVRPCKIGETDYIAQNRRYQVLLDFHERYGISTV